MLADGTFSPPHTHAQARVLEYAIRPESATRINFETNSKPVKEGGSFGVCAQVDWLRAEKSRATRATWPLGDEGRAGGLLVRHSPSVS